jgi:precorrin-3B methylase
MTKAAPTRPVWPFDIAVVGLGIVGAHQLTREVEEVIKRCKHVFLIESGMGISDYLRTLCPEVTNLAPLYERGKSRLPTYRKMAATVVAKALEETPVCLAAYGHPWVYCYPTTLIQRAAAELDLHVEVFAGISAFDTLLVDLGRDIAFDGIQMYEATDLLLRKRPIMTDVTCVIWQATIFGDPTYPKTPFKKQQFEPLEAYLRNFYPSSHKMSLVTSKTHPLARSIVTEFSLCDLAEQLREAPPVGTLYIPPLSSRPIADTALLETMVKTGMDPPTLKKRPGRPVIGPQPTGR